jgi:hypothetical protein
MEFHLISIGNNNTTLEASKSAVFGLGKRAAGKAQARLTERTAPQILAITVPLATALTSMNWAVAVCWMARERHRAQVELARLEAEANKQRAISRESPLLIPGDRSISKQPAR